MSNQLLNQSTPYSKQWHDVPEELIEQGEIYWQKLSKTSAQFLELTSEQQDHIKWQFAMSQFIANIGPKEADFLHQLISIKPSTAEQRLQLINEELTNKLKTIESEDDLHRCLRQCRRQQMAAIAWYDLNAQVNLDDSFKLISGLADLLISHSLAWLYQYYKEIWGTPYNAQGEEQAMFVLGMGKLGGGELNFSSDIDLIFVYPENGETQGGRKSTDNHQFFIRLSQKLIAALHQVTVDGFVYRVDMRLRPYGDSGPLAMSFSMFEDYYQSQGRDWERYAMLKARIITAPQWQKHANVQELYDLFRPFVYRKYIDYSAIDSLRKMKALISQEVKRKGLKDNIKLGAGGIREIEFIVQTFQLIRGGRTLNLRTTSTRAALKELEKTGALSSQEATELTQAYYFLRKTEHVLQELNDEQTQTLPTRHDNQLRVAFLMSYPTWLDFYQALQAHLARVHHVFNHIIGDGDEGKQEEKAVFDYWIDELSHELLFEHLEQNYSALDKDAIWQQLNKAKQEITKRRVGPRGREVLSKLMPLLIDEALKQKQALNVLQRSTEFMLSIATRTAYLELLLENQQARTQLLTLLAASPWIYEQLCKYPLLLDELIDPKQLYTVYPQSQYESELRQKLLRIDEFDLESQMEVLRQFKNAQQLRIAAADITGALPVMKVSDHLSWLAEAVLQQVVNIAWFQMTEKNGVPEKLIDTDNKGFAILGYGKLGGLEFGYGSDLDMVFIHNQNSNDMTVAGEKQKSIPVQQFYMRFAQRIMHILDTRMHSGILYETDMRLRPSGNSGLLVASLAGFYEYQQQKAWTWEHQALVRCRCIVSDSDLQADIEQVRHNILTQKRDSPELQKDVREMREKMRDHLAKGNQEQFDLKQDRGGIADIEFITQFLVLAYSQQVPSLTQWSDNVRILETAVEHKIIATETLDTLIEAYLAYRNEGHKLSLAQQSVIIEAQAYQTLREKINTIWKNLLCS